MARATKTGMRREQEALSTRRSRSRRRSGLGAIALGTLVVVAAGTAVLALRSGGEMPTAGPAPVHVHGLGVDPADGALFIATHTGLFRAGEGERRAVRVGEGFQDTMGFTVLGPNRFLGSGHPDLRQDLPPLLGLIESTDAGESWEPVSLLGEADFHVLRFVGGRLYGYDVTNDRLLTSDDEGRTWGTLARPGPLVDLAVDPGDNRHVIVAAQSQLGPALFESTNGGGRWTAIASLAGLLAWPAPDLLYVVTADGSVFRTPDGHRLERRGTLGAEPAAFLARGPDDLYVALHDGTIKRSTDGGKRWAVRSSP